MVSFFYIFFGYSNVSAARMVVTSDTTINSSKTDGIYVANDCTITFTHTSAITIGSQDSEYSGIEIADGVTLNIVHNSSKGITIHGGTYSLNENIYKCAGIRVPYTSTLNITKGSVSSPGTITIYGGSKYDYREEYSSSSYHYYRYSMGAAIGGDGIYINGTTDMSTECTNAGDINISDVTIDAKNGKCTETNHYYRYFYGISAVIGGGGIYTEQGLDYITGSKLKSCTITGTANITTNIAEYARSYSYTRICGVGAGIGSGGIYAQNVTEVIGGDVGSIVIDTTGKVITNNFKVTDNGYYAYGSGAGIGTGGIYNAYNKVTGGSIDNIEIKNGDITVCTVDPYTVGGAGIGTGSIHAYIRKNNDNVCIRGGVIKNISISGGTIKATCTGNYNYIYVNAGGAGIGGGGMCIYAYRRGTSGIIEASHLNNITISGGSITAEGYRYSASSSSSHVAGAGIGGGSLYIDDYPADISNASSDNTMYGRTNLQVIGGRLDNIDITGGTICAQGGWEYASKATYDNGESAGGVGIGGGTIVSRRSYILPDNCTQGKLGNITIEGNASIDNIIARKGHTAFAQAANIGDGVVAGIGKKHSDCKYKGGSEYDPKLTLVSKEYSSDTHKVTVNVTDQVGLWKITATPDLAASAIYTFQDTRQEEVTLDTDDSGNYTYYIFDKLGHSIKVSNDTSDITPPKVTNAWVNLDGTGIMIEAEDDVGLSCITTLDNKSSQVISGTKAMGALSSENSTPIGIIYNTQGLSTCVTEYEVDENAPLANIKRIGATTCRIVAKDFESGVCKAETLNVSNEVVNTINFTVAKEINEQFTIGWEEARVRVYDGVGNSKIINIPPREISEDTTLTHSEPCGIKVTDNCTITFEHTSDSIQIGHSNSECPGIEILDNVKLTLVQNSTNEVRVYGGKESSRFVRNPDYSGSLVSYYIAYAGIRVPYNSELIIRGSIAQPGEIYLVGGVNQGGGAGIGGNGLYMEYSSMLVDVGISAGTITIHDAKVTATGGSGGTYYSGGAGIGGGGLYVLRSSDGYINNAEGGSLLSLSITGNSVVTATGGSGQYNTTGAGIGGGGFILANVLTSTGGHLYNLYISTTGTVTANGGTGIGGGGLYSYGGSNYAVSLTGGKAYNITIDNGTVTASAVPSNYGGTGIGGGSVYAYAGSNSETAKGGDLISLTINGGTVTATTGGSYAYTAIGGGSVYNTYNKRSKITGGDLHNMIVTGGTIIAENKATYICGGGAGVGGGGICDTYDSTTKTAGELKNLVFGGTASSNNIQITQNSTTSYGKGANIGSGGIYTSNSNYTNGTEYDTIQPKVAVCNMIKSGDNKKFKITAVSTNTLSKIADTNGNQIKALSGTSCTEEFSSSSAISAFRVYDENNVYQEISVDDINSYIIRACVKRTGITSCDVTARDKWGLSKIEVINSGGGVERTINYNEANTNDVDITKTVEISIGSKQIKVYNINNEYVTINLPVPEVTDHISISENCPLGIRVVSDCTITFTNTAPITIGDTANKCPGIDIADGVTLTLVQDSSSTVTIYGGKEDSSVNITGIGYAGIRVPSTSTLNIQKGDISSPGMIIAYGSSNNYYGSAAGIGGNGADIRFYYKLHRYVDIMDAGDINISDVDITATQCSTAYASGAGIGGGGLYRAIRYLDYDETAKDIMEGGSVKSVNITGCANVTAYSQPSDIERTWTGSSSSNTTYCYYSYGGGGGAGIGSGGIVSSMTKTKGGDVGNIVISTTGIVEANYNKSRTYAHGEGAGIGTGGMNITRPTSYINRPLLNCQKSYGGNIGSITINNATIRAEGGCVICNVYGGGAGIGSGGIHSLGNMTKGGYIGNITINGGTVTAVGTRVTATSGTYNLYGGGAGIGNGGISVADIAATTIQEGGIGNITIAGGTVTATSGYGVGSNSSVYGGGAGIGGGGFYIDSSAYTMYQIIGAEIKNIGIEEGTVTATGGYSSSKEVAGGGTGIGSGGVYITKGYVLKQGDINNVNISGGTITAQGGYSTEASVYGVGAGIGTGGLYDNSSMHVEKCGDVGKVVISGGSVTAQGGSHRNNSHITSGAGAGIGCGGVYVTSIAGTRTLGELKEFTLQDTATINDIHITVPVKNYGKGVDIGQGGVSNLSNTQRYDSTPPTVTHTCENNKVVITASDDKSGLWKITDTCDTTAAAVYTFGNTTTSDQLDTDVNGDYEFFVWDKIGNYTRVSNVAESKPVIEKAYVNNTSTTFRIVATDENGFESIRKLDGTVIEENLTGTSIDRIFTVSSEIEGFRVYNNLGKYTEVRDIVGGTSAPTATIERIDGVTIKVKAEDTVWGLSRVEVFNMSGTKEGNAVYFDTVGQESASVEITLPMSANVVRVYNTQDIYKDVTIPVWTISEDTEITTNVVKGINITKDCTITFSNTQSITIGSSNTNNPGISIDSGVELTIVNNSSNTVSIYGGQYISTSYNKGYAGIRVPYDSILNIVKGDVQNVGTIYVYGGSYSGAGIGGDGCDNISNCDSAFKKNAMAGSIYIKDITVYAYGSNAGSSDYASGAGIGTGGISTRYNGSINVGDIKMKSVVVDGTAYVYAKGKNCMYGSGAGIGGGGIYTTYSVYDVGGICVDNIEIRGGTVRAYGGNVLRGGGAGIGGGGIYYSTTSSNDVQTTGGSIKNIVISGGDIEAYGGGNYGSSTVCGSGAGIGGGGSYCEIYGYFTGGYIENIEISGGKIKAEGGYSSYRELHGSGAGIGGGGSYVNMKSARTIYSGYISNIKVSGGEIEAIGGYNTNLSYIIYGSGAGIGGGGTYAINTSTKGIIGGGIKVFDMLGGTIDVTAGLNKKNNNAIYGGGAGVGGGGIYSVPSIPKVPGELTTMNITSPASISDITTTVPGTNYGKGADIGNGGIYNSGGTIVVGANYETNKAVEVIKAYKNSNGTMFSLMAKSSNPLTFIKTKDNSSTLAELSGTTCRARFEASGISATNGVNIYNDQNNVKYQTYFDVDSNGPTIKVSKNSATTCIVTAIDEESGVLKIECLNGSNNVVGDAIEFDNVCANRDTKVVTIASDVTNIRVYDAVGNYSTMNITNPTLISQDTTITESYNKGIRIVSDCTITFANTEDITIGSDNIENPGIDILPGVTLTIIQNNTGVVSIYGGSYSIGSNRYNCAGIYVPVGSTLNINNGTVENPSKIYACGKYGNSGYGCGAGIGGSGIYISNDYSTECTDVGTININNAVVEAQGGYSTTSYVYGGGAGIGTGGVYYGSNLYTGARRKILTGITITGGSVVAGGSYGKNYVAGGGAGIGTGGVYYNGSVYAKIDIGEIGPITISSCELEAKGGYSTTSYIYGGGAGIGTGGVYCSVKSRIVGGNLEALTITGGIVEAGGSYGSGIVYGGGAGIGTGGVYGYNVETVQLSDVGVININNCELKVQGGYSTTSYVCGGGAGIGTGGVYGNNIYEIVGGNLEALTITGGSVVAGGSYGKNYVAGGGAGIGTGGVYNSNNNYKITVLGNIGQITQVGGLLEVQGGYGFTSSVSGGGAGIGSGGVYYNGIGRVVKGEITKIDVDIGDTVIRMYNGNGARIGWGEIYKGGGNVTIGQSLDCTPPVVTHTYDLYTNNVVITACDLESGLWKIARSYDIAAPAVYTFEGSPKQTTTADAISLGDMGVYKFYVFDRAGNYSLVSNEENIEPPVVVSAYRNSSSNGFCVQVTSSVGLDSIRMMDGTIIKEISGTECIESFKLDKPITRFKIFDKLGNSVMVDKFISDNKVPQAVLRRMSDNIYKVGANDETVGLWKIEKINLLGEVEVEYFDEAYQAGVDVEQLIEVAQDVKEIKVYDAVGNVTTIPITGVIEVTEDMVITCDYVKGIKVLADATITFANTKDIVIGHEGLTSPGIEIDKGVTLTIVHDSIYDVSIYGGTYSANNTTYNYAGIYVPEGAKLIIKKGDVDESGTIYAYGNGKAYGTGAGIGGNGIYINTSSVDVLFEYANAGSITIEDVTVVAKGGISIYGTGAGIGGGGIYVNKSVSKITSCVENIYILGRANVVADAGCSNSSSVYGVGAGIGTGGIYRGSNDIMVMEARSIIDKIYISTTGNVFVNTKVVGNSVNGGGAGIGTGGIYKYYNLVNSYTVINNITIHSGNIDARGVSSTSSVAGGGAGIGTGGYFDPVIAGDTTWINNIIITGGTISAKGSNAKNSVSGGGAGIGTGGVWASTGEYVSQKLSSGDIHNIEISGGSIEAIGGCGETSSVVGGGAGIGTGGMCNVYKGKSGDIASVLITGGTVVACAGYGTTTTAGGAGIGTGGIDGYNNSSTKIYSGVLQGYNKLSSANVTATGATSSNGGGANIGTGGSYVNSSYTTYNANGTAYSTTVSVSNAYKNEASNKVTMFATTTGTLRDIRRKDGTVIKSGLSGKEKTISIDLNEPLRLLRVYNTSGNYKEVSIFMEDADEPVCDIPVHNRSNYTLSTKDNDAGLLKITKLDGEVIQDYSDNLRKKEDTFTWSDDIKTIVVYDKVGNSTVVDLRVPTYATPTHAEGMYSTTISDEEGLAKITDAAGEVLKTYTEVSTNDTFEWSDSIKTIFIYNVTGNRTAIEMYDPTYATPEHSGDRYVVSISDNVSLDKVTTVDGEVLKRYEYPTTSDVFVWDDNIKMVVVYNVGGNTTIVDVGEPVVTNVYKNLAGRIFKFTANDNLALGSIDTTDELSNLGGMTGSTATTNFEAQEKLDSFVVHDASGNRTLVLDQDCSVDATAPVVEGVTYENGTYTIRVHDNESGIWKITDRTGRNTYATYA